MRAGCLRQRGSRGDRAIGPLPRRPLWWLFVAAGGVLEQLLQELGVVPDLVDHTAEIVEFIFEEQHPLGQLLEFRIASVEPR